MNQKINYAVLPCLKALNMISQSSNPIILDPGVPDLLIDAIHSIWYAFKLDTEGY